MIFRTKLGATLVKTGKFDEGLKELQAAVAQKPDYDQAHYYLGIVYANQSKMQPAIDDSRSTPMGSTIFR